MAVTSDATRREKLLEGRMMKCPRCRVAQDVLAFIPMEIVEEFAHETNPIYKCRKCRWVFSPALTIMEVRSMFSPNEGDPADD